MKGKPPGSTLLLYYFSRTVVVNNIIAANAANLLQYKVMLQCDCLKWTKSTKVGEFRKWIF